MTTTTTVTQPSRSDSAAYITVIAAAHELGCEPRGIIHLIESGEVHVVAHDGKLLVSLRDIKVAWKQALMTTTCPTWCTLEHDKLGPDWDFAEDGALVRGHRGPRFGSISVGIVEYNDGRPSVVEADLDHDSSGPLSAGQLRQLARDALAAAEWIEASRVAAWPSSNVGRPAEWRGSGQRSERVVLEIPQP